MEQFNKDDNPFIAKTMGFLIVAAALVIIVGIEGVIL